MDRHGIDTKQLLKTLSDDAKSLLGGCFGVLGMPGKSKLNFGMQENLPTKRAEKALAELVEAGAMTRDHDARSGRVEYTVQVNCVEFGRWMGRNAAKGHWPMTEPAPRRAAPPVNRGLL